jgi:AMP nucleosidase
VKHLGHNGVTDIEEFTDADAALERIRAIYERSAGLIRSAFQDLLDGNAGAAAGLDGARYPYLGLTIDQAHIYTEAGLSHGAISDPGVYGATLTRPDLFADYYRDQISDLLTNHGLPVAVGVSWRPIPLPFVVEDATAEVGPAEIQKMQELFHLPDLSSIDDDIVNGTFHAKPGEAKPLALFSAARVDYSLHRLSHYTATSVENFQGFVLFTNYERYVDEFVTIGREQVRGGDDYESFVEPGDVVTTKDGGTTGTAPKHLPQMPAYHLVRGDGEGITLVNIGVGPSNAKTITDHIAVLRPHAWLMLGHCAGLRRSQRLGDYVLAHAYVREDRVLYQDLPLWAPLPPIAEIQVALQEAVARCTGLRGAEMKTRLRTGTVATTDNRNWELRYSELHQRLNQARAIAVDMESATIAANGFRFRVPYGTLLCVSDKPLHGEIKLRGMANAVYRERISQHLKIGLETVKILRENGIEHLHSRKLRGFDEPAFR